jgi:hypothetical protein
MFHSYAPFAPLVPLLSLVLERPVCHDPAHVVMFLLTVVFIRRKAIVMITIIVLIIMIKIILPLLSG